MPFYSNVLHLLSTIYLIQLRFMTFFCQTTHVYIFVYKNSLLAHLFYSLLVPIYFFLFYATYSMERSTFITFLMHDYLLCNELRYCAEHGLLCQYWIIVIILEYFGNQLEIKIWRIHNSLGTRTPLTTLAQGIYNATLWAFAKVKFGWGLLEGGPRKFWVGWGAQVKF